MNGHLHRAEAFLAAAVVVFRHRVARLAPGLDGHAECARHAHGIGRDGDGGAMRRKISKDWKKSGRSLSRDWKFFASGAEAFDRIAEHVEAAGHDDERTGSAMHMGGVRADYLAMYTLIDGRVLSHDDACQAIDEMAA